MFTAVMIFQLAEEGKLKLSDTLDKFYPQIPNASKITIEHLLTMRSGLQSTSGRNYGAWVRSSSWVRFALGRPMVSETGHPPQVV